MVLIDAVAADRDDLFVLLARHFAEAGGFRDPDEIIRRLTEREKVLSTGIGGGVAVPHAQIRGLDGLELAASTHPEGLVYPTLDAQPGCSGPREGPRRRRADQLVGAASGEDFVALLGRLETG